MRILLTGAAGRVAALLLPGLLPLASHLRLADLRPPADPPAAAEIACGDLTDPAHARAITRDVDALIHLGGNPRPHADWASLSHANVTATAALLDAAAANQVPRLVLASSVHAMGGYLWRQRLPIQPDWPTHPCCRYGATKVMVEALGRIHADATGASVICLRLGGCTTEAPRSAHAAVWLSPADLRGLVGRALTAPVSYGIFAGTSGERVFDLSNARQQLGYAPAAATSQLSSLAGQPVELCASPITARP